MKTTKKVLVLSIVVFILLTTMQFCEETALNQMDPQIEFVNPYDFIGNVHNDGVEYLMNEVATRKDVNCLTEIGNLTASYLNSCGYERISDINRDKYKALDRIILEENMNDEIKGRDIPLIKSGTIQNEFLIKLKREFNSLNLRDTSSVIERIKIIEKEIWTSSLSEEDKTALLICSSVGRHSLHYWYKSLIDRREEYETKGRDLRKVLLDCLEADIDGAICGFIAGAIIGAAEGSLLELGVGTITCAIIEGVKGAAYGAVIGSVWKAFKIFVMES